MRTAYMVLANLVEVLAFVAGAAAMIHAVSTIL